jgi:hypothetical protein
MPLVVTFFALRAAMRDARAGRPLYFRTLLLKPAERPRLIRSGLKDVGKIILMAVVLDTTYQILVLKAFYLEELLVVVMASALLPYFVVRSAGSILMRRIYRKHPKATGQPIAKSKEESEARGASTPTTDH